MDEQSRFEIACDWFLRLREEPESPPLVGEWLAWYRQDAANAAAFERVREMWRTTDLLSKDQAITASVAFEAAAQSRRPPRVPSARAPGGAAQGIDAERSGASWRPRAAAPLSPNTRERRRVRSSALAAAAALACAVVGGLFAFDYISGSKSSVTTTTFTTAARERRGFDLPDGSSVELAADSVLKATFHEHRRDIELERGEAYFKVAHDKTRPFIVHAGAYHVRAVGTSFDVRTSDDRVVVAVEEGTVLVEQQAQQRSAITTMLEKWRPASGSRSAEKLPEPVKVTGGQEIAVGAPGREVQLLPIEPRAVASWREGRLRFVREPLRSVIERIRAATGRNIELDDPRLGELRFTGTVFSTRIDSWAQGLPAIFPIEVHDDGAQLVISARE
jgi:transmembrane sensor